MACADVDMSIHGDDDQPHRAAHRLPLLMRHYQALELVPDSKGPLHDLLQKQPAVLGTVFIYHYNLEENKSQIGNKILIFFCSLQMVSGLFSFAVGILFAVTQEMTQSLFTLFRVSLLSGALYIIAGCVSNLLFRYPQLLPVSFGVNCGCIVVAVVSSCLISVDLADWSPKNDQHLRMEVLELCVLGLEIFLSAVLCFWFAKERRAKSP